MESLPPYIRATRGPAPRVGDASSILTPPPDYDDNAGPWYPPGSHPSPPTPIIVLPPPGHPNGTGGSIGAPSQSGPSSKSATTKNWLIAAVVTLLIIISVLGGVLGSRASGTTNSASTTAGSQGEPKVFGPITTSDYTGTGRGGTPTSPSTEPGFSDSLRTLHPDQVAGVVLTDLLLCAGPTSTSESRSVCQGRVCPSLLSVTKVSNDPPRAFVFGRGKDSAVWYRETDGDKWLGGWKSLGGDMRSQVMAASTRDGRVFVVGYAGNQTIRYKAYNESRWGVDWLELGGAAQSAPYATLCGSSSVEIGIRGTSLEGQRIWLSQPSTSSSWSKWENLGGGLSSSLVIGCTQGLFRVAVLGFQGALKPMFHKTWAYDWGGWVQVGGDFRGDLAITTRNEEELLTFGITSKLTMQYNNWTRIGIDKNQLFELGGSFQSVPVVLVLSTNRLDVLAVGTDDRLKHRALIGQTWTPQWQDLGGAFNSTPAVVSMAKDKVTVYGLGVDGAMFHGSWTVSSGFDWIGDGNWQSDGMSFSMEWFGM